MRAENYKEKIQTVEKEEVSISVSFRDDKPLKLFGKFYPRP